ncbi:MAG: tetratricopeptide repeat protein [Vicinamibacterales bacterium]
MTRNIGQMSRLPAFVIAGVLLGIPIVSATAQVPRAGGPLQAATRAFIEGRFDQIESLTATLDADDPSVVALKARAAIARGRYQEAEAMLRPVAQRAPASDAALELGLLQDMLGRADARPLLLRVAALGNTTSDPQELARAARALRALGQSRDANALYRTAAAAAPTDVAINAGWGELFLETYNITEALRSFQAVLQADPRWAPAFIGAARALSDDNPPQAVAMAQRALAINPSSVDAYVFLAQQAFDADHRDEARELVQKALAVNPSSLDARSILAGLAYVEDRQAEFDAEVARALAIAPTRGDVYRVAGEMTARSYRFDEAVVLTRRALALEPENPRALAALGMQLLRTGDEPGARAALDASFKIDPYDVVTFNLLGMLDTLDKFETVTDGDLIFRMSKAEAPLMREFAVPLAHQALDTLGKRYAFTPKGPILIEIFSKHDDFAVRTLGLPGMIGALGACFGRVVTIDSPKAQPPGTFQWESTLWHELAHVITLQMSNQRLPRWLSEGISVFEEGRGKPEWARQQDMEFASLLAQGETLKLGDLNAAFTDPQKISIAYFQASLLVEQLVAVYGDAGLQRFVRSFAQGLDTDAALKMVFNTSFEELQPGFDQLVSRKFDGLKRAMATRPEDATVLQLPLPALKLYAADRAESYTVQMALGSALRRAQQTDEAMAAFEKAAALVPIAHGDDSPHAQMAAIAIEKNDRTRAIAELTSLVAVDFDNVAAARLLGRLLKEAGVTDPARLRPVYQRIASVDPFDADAHSMLGRLAMQRNEPSVASREFRAVVALGPVDRAVALTDLAESYFKDGKAAEAKKQTLAALEIAPSYERAQTLLLSLVK